MVPGDLLGGLPAFDEACAVNLPDGRGLDNFHRNEKLGILEIDVELSAQVPNGRIGVERVGWIILAFDIGQLWPMTYPDWGRHLTSQSVKDLVQLCVDWGGSSRAAPGIASAVVPSKIY